MEDSSGDIECFMCPMSMDVMKDPVVTPSGHSFEKSEIEDWLELKQNNPITREPLTKEQLYPNRSLKAALELWQKQDQEWKSKVAQLQDKMRVLLAEQQKAEADSNDNDDIDNEEMQHLQESIRYLRSRQLYVSLKDRRKLTEKADVGGELSRLPQCLAGKIRDRAVAALMLCIDDDGDSAKTSVTQLLADCEANGTPKQGLAWLHVQLARAHHILATRAQTDSDARREYLAAIAECRKAIELDGENGEAYRVCGWEYDRLGQIEPDNRKQHCRESLALYESAQRHPRTTNMAKLYDNFGRVQRSMGLNDEAVLSFKKALQYDDKRITIKALCSLGEIFKQHNCFDKAEKYFQRAVNSNSNDDVSLMKLGNLYKDMALRWKDSGLDRDECSEHYRKAIALYTMTINETNHQLYANAGFCWTRLGDKRRARSLYLQGLKIKPNDERLLKNLKYV
mmetsp:Transcript_10233/g.17194  ORF Transcript_10233/g.17194 Transcript_10233/m.17194 type:complete len:453 (-) Transcript_10233:6-1364(-)